MMEANLKGRKILFYVTMSFLLIGVAIFLYWLLVLRFEEYTDDAYVGGNMVEITPQVAGIVTAINVDNTDYVEEGQVLIRLDRTDQKLAFEASKNDLADTVRSVVQMFIRVQELEAELEQKDADLYKAKKDYENRVNLVDVGGVSREEFEHVEADFVAAQASRRETYHSLQAAYAEVQNTTVSTHPLVLGAADRVKESYVNLKRCNILAPVTGYVAQRKVQLGEWVNLAEPLMAVIPLDELWVDANFKETKLANMRIGQSVKLTADMYGVSVIFHGKVIGMNPGTGSVFSALPPQNATGNWIKIVQRVPVRVSLDPQQLQKFPLWLGLSMEVTVDIHDTSGERLAEIPRTMPLYKTAIYKRQEKGAKRIIQKIIQENGGPSR
ncbi:Multidrug export protein EmrA [Candidatus Neptunochlamydia vexilliferae]|uniref:Multidrug export protein EmrA n=2 Tax=Candidatus Neptunichlamydia vexilliferae TaxID=1651774 RepID=A0ABS0AZV4_9BACT|nr:Multidrug export protein EmrA [Candidatus Neptunochlamydia vexilliferae]